MIKKQRGRPKRLKEPDRPPLPIPSKTEYFRGYDAGTWSGQYKTLEKLQQFIVECIKEIAQEQDAKGKRS